jgi:hypothetical protein
MSLSRPALTYLDAARLGRPGAWRGLLAVPLILFFWLILGSVPAGVVLVWSGAASADALSPLAYFLAAMASFVCLLLGLWVAVRGVHGRPFASLIRVEGPIRWRRAAQGFGAWFGLAALLAVAEALLFPGRYTFTLDAGSFRVFAFLIIGLVPIQAGTEELVFRGYLLQLAGPWLRRRWALCALSGLLFALPHLGNPEIAVDLWLLLAYYFSFGFFAAFITLKDDGLELALGLHAANNIFAGLLANYPDSALPTPALFTLDTLDPVFNLAASLVGFAAFYGIVFRRRT